MGVSCHACEKDTGFSASDKILRRDDCTHCGADLHCCKMCIYYDTSSYNECREPTAERIVEKEKANYCDHFILSDGGTSSTSKDDVMAAAADLFKK